MFSKRGKSSGGLGFDFGESGVKSMQIETVQRIEGVCSAFKTQSMYL